MSTLPAISASTLRAGACALALLLAQGACAGAATQGVAPGDASSIGYVMVVHPVSGVSLPRIRDPRRPEIERAVNARLDALAADLRCEDAEGETWYETDATVTYAADDVFSVAVRSNFYCGGPYPTNDADSSVTFDLRTGQSVPFRSLFRDDAGDEAAILRAWLARLSREDREGCEDELTAEALEGHDFAYTISAQGLAMRTSFPHVVEACNRTVTLPFAELRPFAASGGLLERLAPHAGTSGGLSAAEEAAVFEAAGFRKVGAEWHHCEDMDEGDIREPGRIEAVGDLDGDGLPEAIVRESSLVCYGNTGSLFVLVSRRPDGRWEARYGAVGIPEFLATRGTDGWPDLVVGGPGFCFPVMRWNGSEYALHRHEYDGRPCEAR